MVSLRSATGPICRNPQQIERAVDLGQVPPGEVERARRRVHGAVAAQELDRVQSHPGFQEMGGTTMPEGMEAFAVADPRGALRAGGDLLCGSDGQGLGAVVSRQEPRRGARERPGGAQCGQQTGRQQRGAVLAAFALLDTHQHAVTCDSGAAEAHDCPDA
jgi:hypothetical protein